MPSGDSVTGILGKWKYAADLDAFVGIPSPEGEVWIYKPYGWADPRGAANQAPQVALSAPSAGAIVPVGTSLQLTAQATDADGAVTKVEFVVNGTKVGEATLAPFIVSWTPGASGSYTITARATDNDGGQSVSGGVTVTVSTGSPPPPQNVSPSIALVGAGTGLSFAAGSPVVMEALAGDSDGSIARVEFYVGTIKVGEDTQAPYSVRWPAMTLTIAAPVGSCPAR